MSRIARLLAASWLAACGDGDGGGGGAAEMVDDPEQASIVALYEEDPVHYWARFGLPTLSRGTLLNEQHRYYQHAFGVLEEAFLPDAFAGAVGSGDGLTAAAHQATLAVPTGQHVSLLRDTGPVPGGTAVAIGGAIECAVVSPPDAGCDVDHLHACDPGGIYIDGAGPIPDPDPEGCGYGPVRAEVDAWLHAQLAIRLLTQALDAAVLEGDAGAIEQVTADLASIYQLGFDGAMVDEALAPQAQLYDPSVEEPGAGPICEPPPGDPPPLPNEMLWTEVADSRAWRTERDGMCAALASGACAARLGLDDDTVTCEEWGRISEQMNATPTGGVADMNDVEVWLKARARARDVPLCKPRFLYDGEVSMCARAYLLRNLGCDVLVLYEPPTGPRHVEMVTDVDPLLEPDPERPDADCVFHTLSWSRSATVEIKRDGTFQNKSDASRYGAEKLQGGDAILHSFCPCKNVPEGT